jgi:hypothetical protein
MLRGPVASVGVSMSATSSTRAIRTLRTPLSSSSMNVPPPSRLHGCNLVRAPSTRLWVSCSLVFRQ